MKNMIYVVVMLVVSSISCANTTPKKQKTVAKIIKLAEEKICNPNFLKTEEWKNFVSKIQTETMLNLDDKSFATAFNEAASELTFSHFYIRLNEKKSTTATKKPFELQEINPSTAILHLRQFVSDASGLHIIIQEITQKNYEHLIIDFRNNSGGTLDAAVVLAQFLTNEPVDAGTFITRSWFEKEGRYPTKEEIQQFPYLKDMSYKGFRDISKELAFRLVLPSHERPTFTGGVYLLTNSNTASACEPLVYAFKRKKIGKIIGERTAGQMMSAEWFKVNEEFSVFIPTVDYMTKEATRLDMVGVIPDIAVSSEKALEVALERIK